MTILSIFIYQLLLIGKRYPSKNVSLLIVFLQWVHLLFQWFSLEVIKTWALQGDVLNAKTPSRRFFWIVFSVHFGFTADLHVELVTTGVKSVFKCAKCLRLLFVLQRISTPRHSKGLLHPKRILTESYCLEALSQQVSKNNRFHIMILPLFKVQ